MKTANKKTEELRVAPLQVFECESLPIPPGTKSQYKGPHCLDDPVEPSALRWWLLGAGTVAVALVSGILIGRFLLP